MFMMTGMNIRAKSLRKCYMKRPSLHTSDTHVQHMRNELPLRVGCEETEPLGQRSALQHCQSNNSCQSASSLNPSQNQSKPSLMNCKRRSNVTLERTLDAVYSTHAQETHSATGSDHDHIMCGIVKYISGCLISACECPSRTVP